ncbi:MAG: hypothetical protein ACTS4U_00265 [Candidatus Hodgkinia cicadicola]
MLWAKERSKATGKEERKEGREGKRGRIRAVPVGWKYAAQESRLGEMLPSRFALGLKFRSYVGLLVFAPNGSSTFTTFVEGVTTKQNVLTKRNRAPHWSLWRF